jgi:hypothetical protein
MRRLRYALLAAGLLALAAPARAFVPQTIVVDGINDFDSSNLLDDDRNDTQTFCSPPALPVDLGRVYVTNDNNYLYIGIEFAYTCFCDMNLGFSIDVNSAEGGPSDPFGRKIGWANLANKPDFAVYDVTPTSCNSFNYEILYKWNTGTLGWDNVSTQVNPSWGSGSNGLGIVDSLTFKELRLPLSVLGASTGTPLRLEFWVTQEGATKGPLDALSSDDVQMSRFSQTTFDTADVVQMTSQITFTVLNAVDVVPPTVGSALAVNFPLLPSRQFSTSTNKVDVAFSEPVELTTAQATGNYAFSGPVSRSVISAVRDVSALNVVHLTLNSSIPPNAAFYNITVTGVQDIAGNPIVANGTTNVGSFLIQTLVFNADLALPLCNGTFLPADTFAVEGSLPPLTFALCDNALLVDANGDSIYSTTVPFAMAKDAETGKAEADLEWKLTAKCSVYESFAGNRQYHLSSDNGASVPINVSWSNEDPSNFLSRAVDVIFQVDASGKSPLPGDVITLLGNQSPLSFTQPGLPMLDNGAFPDAVAGDGIYAARARFPTCANRTVEWKVDFNGVIECADQGGLAHAGNRAFTMNEAVSDTVGGPLGPLTLPARRIDRCQVTDKAIAAVLRVDMFPAGPPAPSDTVAVNGNGAPLDFNWPSGNPMADDGTGDDADAGDYIYTRTLLFPDSTVLNLEYKFVLNGTYECDLIPNRTLVLDDTQYSSVNRLVAPLARWNYCSVLDVPAGPGPARPGSSAAFANLLQSFPNPGLARSTIRFDLKRSGRVTLTVYDVAGRRIQRLIDAELTPGSHEATWNGLDASGQRVKSGIYLYELALGSERLTRRLVLAR